ncbi:VTT domain-containing protein [Candidatus Wolfebacteria bacterium]|nr:VTT domain-containing protein [Candidatus Wolfebacteria bacterium]
MEEFAQNILGTYPVLAPLLFVLLRTLPIVIPPLPGIILDFLGITLFGWLQGFLLAGVGVMLGSMIAFSIARTFREPLVRRFIPLQKLHTWEDRYSETRKFWGLVLLRITTAPAFDYVCYAAGLTKISATRFFLTTFLSATPLGFLIYYFGGMSFAQGPYGIAVYIVSLVLLFLTFKKPTQRLGAG